MVSTPLKNISQNGKLPQIGVKIKHIWNHHLDYVDNVDGLPDSPYPWTFKTNIQQSCSPADGQLTWHGWPAAGPRDFPGETWPATSPGATHESYTFLCWNLKGWQATNHWTNKSTRVFRCYLGIFRCYVRRFFLLFGRCIGIEIAGSTLCSYLESKHLQIYIIIHNLGKVEVLRFQLIQKSKFHQDLKRSI